jgi:Flp pilus assembly protein TadD
MTTGSRVLRTAFTGLFLVAASAALADSGGPPSVSTGSDSNFISAKQAIDAQEWQKAVTFLNRVKADADVNNLLGYSYRHLGNFDEAFRHYKRALDMEPNHRGAHEYVGEAYLLTNNLAMAEQHLAALNRICGSSCEEYADLAKKITEYKQKH